MEPLNFGALCCVSNVCGCVGFAERRPAGWQNLPNMVVADYVSLPDGYWLGSPYDALAIDRGVRDWIEGQNSAAAAASHLSNALPKTEAEMETLLGRSVKTLRRRMSWDVVARDYLAAGSAPLPWKLPS